MPKIRVGGVLPNQAHELIIVEVQAIAEDVAIHLLRKVRTPKSIAPVNDRTVSLRM